MSVSTHVPVKDTTTYYNKVSELEDVSTHVPVKDTTTITLSVQAGFKGFNPRTRKGYDPIEDGGVH